MKTAALFGYVIIVGLSSTAQAAVQFECTTENSKASIVGSVDGDAASLSIADRQGTLGIREFSGSETLEFEPVLRKREERYSFARYYNDYNAWDGLDFSLPKDIRSEESQGNFVAYFTIYSDNGDVMAPGAPVRLFCRTN